MFTEGKESFIFSPHNKEAGDSSSLILTPLSLMEQCSLYCMVPSRMFGTGRFGADWYSLGFLKQGSSLEEIQEMCACIWNHMFTEEEASWIFWTGAISNPSFSILNLQWGRWGEKGRETSFHLDVKISDLYLFLGRVWSDPTQNRNT